MLVPPLLTTAARVRGWYEALLTAAVLCAATHFTLGCAPESTTAKAQTPRTLPAVTPPGGLPVRGSPTAEQADAPPGLAPPAAPKTSDLGHAAWSETCGMPALLRARGWPTELSPTSPSDLPAFELGSTTLVVLPDTQYYADCNSPHFAGQLRWVGEQRSRRNVAAVLTLGDLTEHNSATEWQYIRRGFAAIENQVPVVPVMGNHDCGREGKADTRDTLFVQHFSTPPGQSSRALVETERPGDLANAYYRIVLPRVRLGILVLEWSPRAASVAWANDVLSRNAGDRVIFITHAYLYHDDTRYDWWTKAETQEWNPLWYDTAKRDPSKATTRANLHPDGAHDGEMLWQQLIKKHAGVFLTLNGHVLVDGTGRLTSRGDHGNTVHQVLVNYQMLREGGLGYLRLVELLADGTRMRMKTYSPSLDRYATAAEHTGDLTIEPALW